MQHRDLTAEIHDHCQQESFSGTLLRERFDLALPLCLDATGDAVPGELEALDEIEISLISDDSIAAIHGEFLNDPTPTDVITFPHGEILVSAETAARCAKEFGHPAEREALLYVIHGLLHLNGHDDLSEPARRTMHREQERILESVWPFPHPENRG